MTHQPPAGRRPGPARLAAAVLLGCWLLLAGAAPASAHASLVGTDPTDGALLGEPPDDVTLSFDEPVRLTSQEITVYDAEGRPLESTARTSGTDVVVDLDDPASLGRGTFVLGWFVVSADGHPISGSLTFSVGERSDEVAAPPAAPTSSGTVTAVQGAVSALAYVGLLVATGLAGFLALVLPASYAGDRVRSRIRRLARLAAAVGAAGTVLSVPVASVNAQGAELGDAVTGFDPGLVGDEVLAAGLVVLGLVTVAGALADRLPEGTRRAALLAGAAVALLGPPLAGHTRSYQPSALLIASDVVHLLAGATWLGGLVGLALTLRALAGRERLAAATLARFSGIAAGVLLAVAASGTVLAWRVLGYWSALLETGYGRLLLVKVAIALVVAALGGWNRVRLLPRVERAAGFADRGGAATVVQRALRFEALALVALLVVTGFLVSRSPRPAPVEVPPGRTGVQDGRLSDIEVLVLLDPRQQGGNTLLVQLLDESGEPVVTDRPPDVRLRSAEVDLGSVPLTSSDAGTWSAHVLLPDGGAWTVEVGLRLGRFEHPVTTVGFDVADR